MAKSISKRVARTRVEKLVAQFVDELPAIKRGRSIKEAHIEEKYLKPLFRALNWNTDNEGLPLYQEEFVVQATQSVGGTLKAPDYLLRLPDPARPHAMKRHLFIEAKHPKYDLKTDLRWIRQTYLYAHSTMSDTDRPENRVRLALLTDFEEFRLFDCIDPEPLTINSIGAFNKQVVSDVDWTCQDYIERFDELWESFERGNVYQGSLAKHFVTPEKKVASRVPPDIRFLNDLERFRVSIAQGIVAYNPKLSDAQITAAAQLVLDRIVFVKMLHDRGLERDHLTELVRTLKQHPGDSVSLYDASTAIFEDVLDRLYNGRLFKRRDELDDVKVDNRRVREILEALAPERAIYTLAAMPVEIIGYAYEKFLGRVILRTGKTVQAVDKPEVRRSGGVYYTPRHIVEEIVDRSLGKALQSCRRPEDVASIRVLDPACGSGSFLIVAYERILAWHRRWFVEQVEGWINAQGRVVVPASYRDLVRVALRKEGRVVRLTLKLRREILLTNIYGVDIDEQAVEVTRFSLAMKELEDVTRAEIDEERSVFKQQILPDLTRNIRVGNSLIGPDLPLGVSKEDRRAARPFLWRDEFPAIMRRGFDVVIGNPPYDVMEKDRGSASWPHEVLQRYVDEVAHGMKPALGGKRNLFRFFVVRAIELLRDKGHFGMIVPLSLLADVSTSSTRRHVLTSLTEFEADCFPQKDNASRRVFRDAKLSTAIIVGQRAQAVPASDSLRVRTFPWDNLDDAPLRTCEIVRADLALLDPNTMPVPLVDDDIWRLCVRLHRHPGVVRLGDRADFEIRRGEVNQTTYREFITLNSRKSRLLKGSEIAPYRIQPPSQGQREWFDERACLATFKRDSTREEWRALAGMRRIATQRITGVDDSRRLIAVIVEPECYFADSTNSISSHGGSLEYLVALLNSDLWQWRFRLTSTNNNVQTNELEGMPFRVIDRKRPAEVKVEAEIVGLVRRIGALQVERATLRGVDAIDNEREALRADRRINELISSLYGVTEGELALIERSAKVSGTSAT